MRRVAGRFAVRVAVFLAVCDVVSIQWRAAMPYLSTGLLFLKNRQPPPTPPLQTLACDNSTVPFYSSVIPPSPFHR